MKKNVMMRLASFLLVAVLISTSAISGTYAKYVTQDSGADQARVAKWGISLQVVGDLFGVSYKNGIVPTAVDEDDAIRVQASDYATKGSNVVAPGTLNAEGMSFGLTGTPEVDYQITAEIISQNIYLMAGSYAQMVPVEAGKINAMNYDHFKAELYTGAVGGPYTKAPDKYADFVAIGGAHFTLEDNFTLTTPYYPVVFDLAGTAGTDVSVDTTYTADSLEVVADKIADALNGSDVALPTAVDSVYTRNITSKEYDTNVAIEDIGLSNMSITWEWAFERKDAGVVIPMYDYADTVLGNLIADREAGAKLEGEIVKTTDSGDTYVALAEDTDYCLDTQFSLNITVTQVD